MSCCRVNKCRRSNREQPILRPIATSETLGSTYIQPSGPFNGLAVPVVGPADVGFEIWDGDARTWTTSALTQPLGGSYTWWNTLMPPSTMIPNFGTVTGVLPQAWTDPHLSIASPSGTRYFVAGMIGTVPTLTLYQGLVPLTSVVLPGPPTLVAYDGANTVAVAGTSGPGLFYLVVYNLSVTNVLTQLMLHTYGVEVTSISLYNLDTTITGVSRPHVILLVTTNIFYLPGEVVTTPGPIIPLATAPPGDIFMYEVATNVVSPYIVPSPVLLFADRYGGLLSGAYSYRQGALFAVNLTGTIVTWSVTWSCDAVVVMQSPESVGAGVQGVYVNEYGSESQLIAYGADRAIAYEILSLPWVV